MHALRIYGLDLARAVAVFGMIAEHLSPGSPVEALTSGYPSSLFAVLAGCSTAIMMAKGNAAGGAELSQARYRLLLRGVIIGVIGIALSWVQSYIAVVLGTIAWIFLLLGPVTRMRTRNVAFFALGFSLASALVVLLTSFFYNWYPTDLTGVYPFFAWLAYGTFGILIHRLLLQAPVSAQVCAAVVGIAVYALSAYARSGMWLAYFGYGSKETSLSDQAAVLANSLSADAASTSSDISLQEYGDLGMYGDGPIDLLIGQSTSHSGGLIDIWVSGLAAMGVIATCLLIMRSAVLVKALFPMRAIGQMALTAYVIHVITAGIYLSNLYSEDFSDPTPEVASISSSSDSGYFDSKDLSDSAVSSGSVSDSKKWGSQSDLGDLPGYTCGCWTDEDYIDESDSWSAYDAIDDSSVNDGWWPFGLSIAGLLVLCPLWLYWYPRGPFEQLVRSLTIRGTNNSLPPLDA